VRWDELDAHIGEPVTLTGTALDGAAGAIVMLDDHPVYVAGLERWPDELSGEEVEVRGTVARRAGSDAPIHRVSGSAYTVQDARWSAA
jgi:hypothetical protein